MNSVTTLSPPSYTCMTAHTVSGKEPSDLVRIFEPSVQLAIWERPEQPEITQYLTSVAMQSAMSVRQILHPKKRPELAGLPAGTGRATLVEDIRLLADMLTELLDAPAIGMRVEMLSKPMCPKLHIDKVGIRLLCTYTGPGTEWLDDRLAQDESHIERIPTFAVALLKGSLWQGNEGRGIIHRSPACQGSGALRIIVAMDAIWN